MPATIPAISGESNKLKTAITSKNNHRAKKRSFQADLKPEESEVVNRAKTKTGERTDRGFLMKLARLALK